MPGDSIGMPGTTRAMAPDGPFLEKLHDVTCGYVAFEGIAICKSNVTTRQIGGNLQAFPAGSKVWIVLNRHFETCRDHVLHPAFAATAPRITVDRDVRERRRSALT